VLDINGMPKRVVAPDTDFRHRRGWVCFVGVLEEVNIPRDAILAARLMLLLSAGSGGYNDG